MGGGYTYLKVDVEVGMNPDAKSAKNAEAICQKYGLQLFIPRDEAHVALSYQVATSMNVTPVDANHMPNNGMSASAEYLKILGIYPKFPGSDKPEENCEGQPFTNMDCPQWEASDLGSFWVSGMGVNGEPKGGALKTCEDCSMSYLWSNGPKIVYATNGDATSHRFMCDTPWSEWPQ